MPTHLTNIIFVDESGDIGLKSATQINQKPYYVFGFVYCEDPKELRKRLKRYLKRLHVKGRYPLYLSELKFYLPYTDLIQKGYAIKDLDQYNTYMPTIRTKALDLINHYSNGVFAAVIDKRKATKTWTEERLGNFVFAETVTVSVMNNLSPANPPAILYDQGRLSPAKSVQFKSYLINKDGYLEYKGYKRYRGSLAPPVDVSSLTESGVWAADLVAGAFYHKYTHNDWTYANMLTKSLIGGKERVYW